MAATMEGLQKEADKKPITPLMKKTPEEVAAPVKAGNVAAAQAGTREALSAIFGSMKSEDYQRELVALQQQGLQIQQQQLDALEGIAADEGEGID
jgi:hypothetical protein